MMLASRRGNQHARMLANNPRSHAQRLFKKTTGTIERSLGNICISWPYLSVEIEEVKGIHAYLDFDLWGVHVLKRNSTLLVFFTLKTKKKWYPQISSSNLGTCYKELFDLFIWKVTHPEIPSPLYLLKASHLLCARLIFNSSTYFVHLSVFSHSHLSCASSSLLQSCSPPQGATPDPK